MADPPPLLARRQSAVERDPDDPRQHPRRDPRLLRPGPSEDRRARLGQSRRADGAGAARRHPSRMGGRANIARLFPAYSPEQVFFAATTAGAKLARPGRARPRRAPAPARRPGSTSSTSPRRSSRGAARPHTLDIPLVVRDARRAGLDRRHRREPSRGGQRRAMMDCVRSPSPDTGDPEADALACRAGRVYRLARTRATMIFDSPTPRPRTIPRRVASASCSRACPTSSRD